METAIAVAVVAVLSAWAVVAFAIWRWGPGRRKLSVRCPTRQVRGRIMVEQREGEFGSLRVADVVGCSLLPEGPPTCGKQCLPRL